jgi:hypothetical protein
MQGDGSWNPSADTLHKWQEHGLEMCARARVWAAEAGGSEPARQIPRIMVGGIMVDKTEPTAAHVREAWERAAREISTVVRLTHRARESGDATDWERAHVASMAALAAEEVAASLDNRVLLAQPGI